MNLFNKYKNEVLLYLVRYMNHVLINPDTAIDASELSHILSGNGEFYTFQELIDAATKDNYLLSANKQGKLEPTLPIELPIRPSEAELDWILYLLDDPYCQMFLSDTLREKLRKPLAYRQETTVLRHEYIDVRHSRGPKLEILNLPISLIIQAILEHRYLVLTNKSFSGTIYKDVTIIPYKLDFSVAYEHLSLVAYAEDSKRPIRMNLVNLTDIQLGDIIPDYEEQMSDYKKQLDSRRVSDPIVIEVQTTNDTLNRLSYLFSGYERLHTEHNGKHIIELYYYSFQKEDVMQKLLSLGPYIRIQSPSGILDEYISEVKATYQQYYM